MRLFDNTNELISEILRDFHEIATTNDQVITKSFQNQVGSFETKELFNYFYSLLSFEDIKEIFLFDARNLAYCEQEFKDRLCECLNPGESYKLRPDVWKPFLNADGLNGRFDYTYSERIGGTRVGHIIRTLSNDSGSRQAFLPIFWQTDMIFTGGAQRIPCSLGYQFNIRQGKLHLTYLQRSCDFVTHWANDVYMAWKMLEFVAEQLQVPVGYFHHMIISFHIYKTDVERFQEAYYTLIGQQQS